MKNLYRSFTASIFLLLILVALTGCAENSQESDIKIKVAASATPMTDVVLAAGEAIEEGFQVELIETSGYFTPNVALRDGEVDANFIQHEPHMQDFNEGNNANLIVVSPIYYVVGSFYSKNYESMNALPQDASVVIPNDSNQGRALELLQDSKLIVLDAAVPKFEARLENIVSNPNHLQLIEVDLMNLNAAYDEADAVYNLGSFARQINLFPETDGLISEFDKRFAVSLVAREDNSESPEIIALEKAFKSDRVREVLEELDQKIAF